VASRDVFLSYRSRDRPLVAEIARRLREAHLTLWFDFESQTAGRQWMTEIGEAIEDAGAVAVCVGPDSVGGWEDEEVAVALRKAVDHPEFRVFPVLLPGVEEPFDPNRLPHFLRTRTWVDLRAGLGHERAFQSLVNAVKGVPFDSAPPELSPDTVCPYRGLQVFDAEHAGFFFGREGDVQRLLEKLKAAPFLVILGPSGGGKSSLARAGLIPALSSRVRGPPPLVLRPGAHPLAALATPLAQMGGAAMQATLDRLAGDARTLDCAVRLAMEGRPPAERFILCVDQFEEAFTLCRDAQARSAFFANLVEAGTAADARALVILTLRADFYPRLAAHGELAQLASAHQFLVGPLSSAGLRAAIVEPAHLVGLTLEAGLAETILEDVQTEPGSLPLLEHALLELWKRRRGTQLTLEAYRETGGVEGALKQRAEEVYAGLSPEEQELARRLLLRLTQPGEGAQDTRRRASLRELGGLGAGVQRVWHALADARLITVSGTEVEVTHEALIRGWERLRGWIEADREGLRIRTRLTAAAAEWTQSEDPACLYEGSELAAAEELAQRASIDLNEDERRFLAASRSRERRRTAFRVYANVLLVAVLAACVITVIALRARGEANRQRAAADSGRLAATAFEELSSAPDRSVGHALQALDRTPTRAAEAALRRAVSEDFERVRMRGHRAGVLLVTDGAALTHDERYLVTAGGDGRAAIWATGSGRPLRWLEGHDDKVRSAAFAPGGGRVVTGGNDRTARIWNVRSGRPEHVLRGHGDTVWAARFSPDGRRVLTQGDEDGLVGIWDVATGRRLHWLHHPDGVASAVFDPSGRQVLTACWDGRVRIWNARNGQVVDWFGVAGGEPSFAAFSPDGRRVVTTSSDGTVRLQRMPTGETIADQQLERGVETAAFSSDGNRLVTTAGKDAQLWDTSTGRRIDLIGHADFVNSAAFSPDGSLVVTASNDDTARVWDVKTGRELRVLRGHTGPVSAAVFERDGKRVLTASDDTTAREWDTDFGATLRHKGWVLGVAFDDAGTHLATTDDSGVIRTSSAPAWSPGLHLRYPVDATKRPWIVDSVRFSADGRWLVTTAFDGDTFAGAAQVWNARTGALRRNFPMPERRDVAFAAALSPDGDTLVTASNDARVWDVRRRGSGRLLRGHTEPVVDAAFNRDGSRIVTASADGTARVWNARTRALVTLLRTPGSAAVNSAAFSPDGQRVVTASSDGVARVWALAGPHMERELRGHPSPVYDVAFRHGAREVVTAGNDGTTRIWDVRSGVALAVLRMHAMSVNAVAVSGDLIATGSDDQTVRVYRCRTCGTLDAVRGRARDYLAAVGAVSISARAASP
jgi:WD40 repeat protein